MKGATNNSAISHLYPNLKGSHQCLLKEWRNWDSPKSNVPMSQESHNPHLSAWCWRSLAFSTLILTHCSVSHCLWLIWGLCIPARTPSIIPRRWHSFDFEPELTERVFTDIPAQLLRGRPGSLHVLSPEASAAPFTGQKLLSPLGKQSLLFLA